MSHMIHFSYRLASMVAVVGFLTSLAAQEPALDFPAIVAKTEANLSTEERNYHLAQAKVKEELVKEFQKLLKSESKRKSSTLIPELETRIADLNKEIELLKDADLYRVTQLDQLLKENHLSEQDWNSAPGTVFAVKATELQQPTEIVIESGQKYYVLPNPKDVWKSSEKANELGYGGNKDGLMKLVVRIGETEVQSWWLTDPGPLSFGVNDKSPKDNTGEVRVKVIRVH